MLSPFHRPIASTIRPLRTPWLEACARIHAGSFAQAWTLSDFENLLDAENVLADAAVSGDGLLVHGFVLSRVAVDEAEILTLAVDAARRRHGVGRALLQAHCRRLAAQGVTWLFLEVEAENRAARMLYDRAGFVRVGERPSYYAKSEGVRTTALVMRQKLSDMG